MASVTACSVEDAGTLSVFHDDDADVVLESIADGIGGVVHVAANDKGVTWVVGRGALGRGLEAVILLKAAALAAVVVPLFREFGGTVINAGAEGFDMRGCDAGSKDGVPLVTVMLALLVM